MKYLTIVPVVFLLLLTSCNKKDDNLFMVVDGTNYNLNEGSVVNLSDSKNEYGTFQVNLTDNNLVEYFSFRLLCDNMDQISEGTYLYDFWPGDAFKVSYLECEIPGSISLSEQSHEWTGNVSISIDNDKYTFMFDLVATDRTDEKQKVIISGGYDKPITFE